MSGAVARVEFVPTLDERADVAVRFAEGSPALRRRNRIAIALTTVVASVLSAAAVYFVLRHFNEERPRSVVSAAVIVALLMMWRLPVALRRDHVRRLRKAMAELYGGDTHPFAVELHADRVAADAGRFAISVPWRQILDVQLIDGDVEIRSAETLIVVRGRAFASATDAKTFFDTADGLRIAATTATAGSRA